MKQEFIDPIEIPTPEVELEHLQGKILYKKWLLNLHTRNYKRSWEIIRKCVPLSPLQRVIVALRFFENNKHGYSYRKIGKILGMDYTTVYRKLKDALFRYRLWAERHEIK